MAMILGCFEKNTITNKQYRRMPKIVKRVGDALKQADYWKQNE
jgi:hypothetical protein